uniref:EGF-like domain-containing protein n=2 Tax=Amphimedon queenslandica TaxID=400682 RepID=A0A1X7TZR4_AMPQE
MTAASRITLLVLVCFCLYEVSDGQAADRTTYGNDFYIGIFRATWSWRNGLNISTLSTQLVNFTIDTEIGWNYTGNVSVYEPVTVYLPSVLEPLHANYSERHKGIHVHSDSPISVIVSMTEYEFSGEYLAYPYIDLGQQRYEYYVVSASASSNIWIGFQSMFLLVGNENDTTITITPTQIIEVPVDPQDPNSTLVAVGPGNTHTITLHQMQTLAIGTSTRDLTGTAITSDKPLTVISGHQCGTLSDELPEQQEAQQLSSGWGSWLWLGWTGWCDYLVEQIPPTVTWGKRFLIVPFPNGTIHHYNKIIASAHDTTVTQTCNGSIVADITLSSPGDWNSEEWNITYDPRAYCVIESDKPILVMQFSAEGYISHVNASYFSFVMSIVPSVKQYINTVLYSPVTKHYFFYHISFHYVHITTTDTSSVLLDGVPYNWTWYPITNQNGNTVGYGTIHKFSDVNPHVLQHTNSSAGLSVTAYGSNTYDWHYDLDAYALLLGMKLNVIGINEIIHLSPWYGHIFGGVPVILTVPEYIKEELTITCQFHDIEVRGFLVSPYQVLCITPQLNVTGRAPVQLKHQFKPYGYNSSFYSQSIEHEYKVNIISNDLLIHAQDTITLTWIPTSFSESTGTVNTANLCINIKLHIFTNNSVHQVNELASNISNNGSCTVSIPTVSHSSAQIVYPAIISIEAIGNNHQNPILYDNAEGTVKQWTDMIWISNIDKFVAECKTWSTIEHPTVGEALLSVVRSEVPCPPTIDQARTINSGLIQNTNNKLVRFLHPNADKCYHQQTTVRTQGSSNECCYDTSGQLIIGPTSGGSVDKASPIGSDSSNYLSSLLSHQQEDILPYIHCCKGSMTNCNEYYKRRPSDNGTAYVPPIPAWTIGDPHIITLDQYKYTFNGKGEFILIETDDESFTLQGRMMETQNGTASVFTAVVAKTNDSSGVQFEIKVKYSITSFVCLVNGEEIDFSEIKSQEFDDVTVYETSNNTFGATFTNGAYLQAQEQNGFISLITVGLPKSFYNRTRGLMGIFNGDMDDDMTPKGDTEPLPLNSTLQTIHESFGITWIIGDPSDSLFIYDFPKRWSTYYDPSFTPVYEPVFTDPNLEEKANEICGNDDFCKFDIAATGRTEIGEATLNGGKIFDAIVNLSQPIICDPPCVHGACVSTDVCACGEGYEGSTCDSIVTTECVQNPCNGGGCQYHAGSYICTCLSGLTGDFCEENIPTATVDATDTANIGLVVGLTVGILIPLVIVTIIAIIVVVLVIVRRKRNKKESEKKYTDQQEMKEVPENVYKQ